MRPESTVVLIVGGGPSGLAAAIELGMRNVPCLLIEQNDRVGYAPRAKTTHIRTREHLRRWGIADRLAAASPFGVDYPSNVVLVTRLGGHELARIENAFNCAPERNPLYSEHAQWIPQYILEHTLRDFAATLPCVELRFNCALESFEQADGAVSALARNVTTGDLTRVDAKYLVGADGARSRVRELIGVQMEGDYGLSKNFNIIFRAPGLERAHRHGPAIMYWQVNPDAPSLIGPMDRGDLWFFMPTGVPEDFTLSQEGAADLIRRSTGIDHPIEILSADEWVASQLIATRYQNGNVFLVGDACHIHPPFGGYGMNMGIADAVDLGWKMAATLEGWGGARLLDSYEAERRPVHRQVIDEAVSNHSVLGNQLWREGLEEDSPRGAELRRHVGSEIARLKRREFKSLNVVLGVRYGDSPIVAREADPGQPPPMSGEHVPSAAPGRIAPHLWLDKDTSLYSLFGSGFTLLATEELPAGAAEKIRQDAAARKIPLKILQRPDKRLAELYQARLALIRPDQHVAWRGRNWPGDHILALAAGWGD